MLTGNVEPARGDRRQPATDQRPTTRDEPPAGEAQLRTVGVEEEFLLVDPATGIALPAVEQVLDRVPAELSGQVQREFLTSQVEIGSPPGLELSALRHSLALLRTGLATAARESGVRLLAVGTTLVDGPAPALVENERFHRIDRWYGPLASGTGMNGLHVHVGIPDAETGVQVLNHVRPWLPILQAITVNSPFHAGTDTGYGSWRSMLWQRWPSVGPTPWLRSHAHYESLIDQLVSTEMILDEGMLYWYGRLSAKYPTVEIRIGDVCPALPDTLLVAALTRALVATALAEVTAGAPPLPVEQPLLDAAHWRAAHDGLAGHAVVPGGGGLAPAWSVLEGLFERLTPELARHGDLDLVRAGLNRLRSQGTGADRQRAVHARTGDLISVIDDLAEQTAAGDDAGVPPEG